MLKDLVGQKIGNYEIVRLLGKGGMGEVYVAHHPVLDRQVAVKVLSRALSDDEELVARFRQEAQAAGRIGHEAIIEVTDFGVLPDDDRCYYVMELLQGSSLEEYLEEHGTVTVSEAVAILRPILEALAAAHAAGIVHRDIKPDNIFLHRDSQGRLKPKLLDFGIAKLLDPTQSDSGVATRTGQLLGTPLYMSPEQASGETQNIGPWSDVYSVAAVLFRMLTGEPPFKAKSFGALLLKHMQEPPPDLSNLRPELPTVLSGLIQGGMAKEPDARHQTVRSFLLELEADVPEGEQPPDTIQLPTARVGMATEPTMRADSSQALSPTALASTTPASLITGKATGAELMAATGGTSLSGAAAEQIQAQVEGEPPRPRSWAGIIGGGAAAVIALGLVLVWALGGFSKERPPPRNPTPATGMDAARQVAIRPPPRHPPRPRPARPVVVNPWVHIKMPTKPVKLGLAEVPAHEIYFRHKAGLTCCDQSYAIQEHEVTWGNYEAWAGSDPVRVVKPPAHVPGVASERRRHPVVGVSYKQALSYCRSLGGNLPTEAQHEYAARGPRLWLNPWGSQKLDRRRVALLLGTGARPSTVCSADQDTIRHSGRRICDLAANALEWTRDRFVHPQSPKKPPRGFPFGGDRADSWRAVRGLPPWDQGQVPRAASLYRSPGCVSLDGCVEKEHRTHFLYTGFRCVRAVKEP